MPLRIDSTRWLGLDWIIEWARPKTGIAADAADGMEATDDPRRDSRPEALAASSCTWVRATCLRTSALLVVLVRKATAMTAAIIESISLGRASTMSCQPQKTRAPILCEVEMASLALSCWSNWVIPGLIMPVSMASGATAAISRSRKTPDLISGSPKRESWMSHPPAATCALAHARTCAWSMSSSAMNCMKSMRISCHHRASVSLGEPSAMSEPAMPTNLIPSVRATCTT
mmetsp:Transcript_25868/g.81884  ORF Transcript_25868/g.81884 Transcript_25868/m.81884 type:complete len:230 (-) Transcript_25868:416-1105(-)